MQTIIIGILIIAVPMIAYCVGTVMRDEMYAKEADGEITDAKDNKNFMNLWRWPVPSMALMWIKW